MSARFCEADNLLPRHKALYEKYGAGHVTVYMCPICGHTEWSSTDSGGKPGILFKDMLLASKYGDTDGCKICIEIQNRAPEIFGWVLLVLDQHGIKSQI